MSREIRRVPLNWKHPTKFNPYWERQSNGFLGVKRQSSRLHAPTENFVALMSPSYTQAHAEWVEENTKWNAGTHETQKFLLNYHSPEGYLDPQGIRDEATPYTTYDETGEIATGEYFFSSIEDLLAIYPYSNYSSEPKREYYMPDFPEDVILGYCLYETVGEGTPTTPVFATQEELIDWLTTMGEDYDQVPLRLESAITIVRQGGTIGSMMVINNQLLLSVEDADKIESLHGRK